MHQAIAIEFRREPRLNCDGDVTLAFENSSAPEAVPSNSAVARMLDVSDTGFRAAHNCADLRPGIQVRFNHKFFVGLAKVVWTHPRAGRLESGFQIIHN